MLTMGQVAAYGMLYASVALLWLPAASRIAPWQVTLLLSFLFCGLSGLIQGVAWVPLVVLGVARWISQSWRAGSALANGVVLIVAAGLGAHLFPGFHNVKILNNVLIGRHAVPYTLFLNIDKTIVGILLLGIGMPLIMRGRDWRKLIQQVGWRAGIVIVGVLALALTMRFVQWDPKLPAIVLLWALVNLLGVCVAEEAFFRGFLQHQLALLNKKVRYGEVYAILIAALCFGLVHAAGGFAYVVLATLLGVGCGWIYAVTRRIEGAILAHFGVNLVHFLFFTYPAWNSAS